MCDDFDWWNYFIPQNQRVKILTVMHNNITTMSAKLGGFSFAH
jgi:hypothetical protein